MAFCRLVLFASKLNRVTKKLKTEKEAAVAITRKEKPKYGWRLKLAHLWINCKKRARNCMINSYFLRNTAFDRFIYRLRKYGSLENYILKSIFGFLGGFLLTYLLFMFLAVQLNVRITVATLICCVLGCILTIGLAFSQTIRCIVFLTLPQFFSKRGRQALIAYALILTMTGPAKNTLNNMGIMSESLACGQEQLKSAVRQILDVIKKPFIAIKDAIKAVIKTVKEIIKKIKEILIKIKRVIMSILGVIKSVFQFLGKILNICNKELGTPYQRCSRVFETAVTDCQANLGPFFSWACSVGYLLGSVCYLVKPFDLICMLVDFLSNSIIGVVVRKVKNFIRHVKTMFYVRIKFSHSFHFESKSSKSLKEIAKGIVQEVKMRTKSIVSVFQFFNCAASLFFIFLIFRVIYYRHKFLTRERFDNRFLTKNLVEIDLRRAAHSKETILPLNHRERKKYITVKSVRLIDTEQKQLSEGLALLMNTALKCGTHMAIDYSLFWVMNLIRKYGKFQSKVQAPNVPTVHIAGDGLLADLLKGVVKSFQPLGINLEIDTVPCLPTPIPPDIDRYIQIASLLGFCLLLTIFEPYGLRWRHAILCYYYPQRAKERAVWLYNHILRSRSSFLKFARRQLRRKVLGTKKISKVTCLEYLRSKTNNKCLLLFLGSDRQQACLLCAEVFRSSDKEAPIRCQRPGCTAMYCHQCFEDLENICSVCLSPIEYGDMSDISEERDSSDEDYAIISKPSVVSESYDSGRSSEEETEEESGREDGGSSTDDYSYGYQEAEKAPSVISDFKTRSSSRDLEKQHVPDYVSMQSFDDEIELYNFSPHGLNDVDEGTQFPEESSLSVPYLTKNETAATSSVASSFERDKKDYEQSVRSIRSRSCHCLSSTEIEDPTAGLLLDDLRGSRFSTDESRTSEQPGSCHCLSSDKIDDPTASLLLEELKGSNFFINRSKYDVLKSSRSNLSGKLQTIQEESEDEPLIDFSSDEEKEIKNTMFESESMEDSSPHTNNINLKTGHSKFSINEDGNIVIEGRDQQAEEALISDSELSETDVVTLIGKPKRRFSRVNEATSESSETETEVPSEAAPLSPIRFEKTIPSSDSSTTKGSSLMKKGKSKKELRVTQSDSSISEIKQRSSRKLFEQSNLSTVRSSERHIEFIGLNKKKKASPSSNSSSDEDTSKNQQSSKKYKSTISTKTSVQDVPSHMKEKKSILKLDSSSSVLSDIKLFKEKLVVPKLKLESTDSDATSSTSSSLIPKKKFDVEYDIISEVPKKGSSKITAEMSGEKERLKGGTNLQSEDSTITFIKQKRIIQEKRTFTQRSKSYSIRSACSDSSDNEECSSPTYPFLSRYTKSSTSSTLSSSSISNREAVKCDKTFFESSDTSITFPNKKRSHSEYATLSIPHFPYKFDLEDLTTLRESLSSMSTDLVSHSPKTEKKRSSFRSSGELTEKKSVRISEISEDIEEDNEEAEETDASSDLSISVQENILGYPKKRGKRQEKIDWQHEKEIQIELPEQQEKETQNEFPPFPHEAENKSEKTSELSEKIEEHREQSGEENDAIKNTEDIDFSDHLMNTENRHRQDQHSSNFTIQHRERSSDEQATSGDQNQTPDEHHNLSGDGSNTRGSKCTIIQKFILSKNDPKFKHRRENKCNCCKCRDKLLIAHDSPAGDPDRRILIHTGVDSCTQTSIDRSDRSCQIDCPSGNMESKSSQPSYKSNTTKCKYKKDDRTDTSGRHEMERDCSCEICSRQKRSEDEEFGNRGGGCSSNTCRYLRKDIMIPEFATTSNRKCILTKRKSIGTVCKPKMQDRVCSAKRTYEKDIEAYTCEGPSIPDESDDSPCSDSGSYRDRFDLPYQDNDEYRRLVRELEEKLVARNRERVRRTMREFEKCSTRNQNLRKPVLYDESSCGEEPILTKLVHLKAGDSGMRPHERGHRSPPPNTTKRAQVRGINTVETMARYLDPNQCERLQRYPRFRDARDPTHWQMDTDTGEWYKVSDVNICDPYESYDSETRCPPIIDYTSLPRRRIMEMHDEGYRCEDCDELNRRYGHRYNILYCPRHRSDRFPRHRRK